MRIIPVMDLKRGIVVHAVGGRRDAYQPIRSVLTDSTNPVSVARSFRDRLELAQLYVADLDAIAGAEPAWAIYEAIMNLGLELVVDAGIRQTDTARALHAAGIRGIVAGLETAPGPELLGQLVEQLSGQTLWFSLDLRDGRPLTDSPAWAGKTPLEIAAAAGSAGVRRVIVLDLARVGEPDGIGTAVLCRQLLLQHPYLELVAGGGIRNTADLDELKAIGVSGALIATALHRGTITAMSLSRWSSQGQGGDRRFVRAEG